MFFKCPGYFDIMSKALDATTVESMLHTAALYKHLQQISFIKEHFENL